MRIAPALVLFWSLLTPAPQSAADAHVAAVRQVEQQWLDHINDAGVVQDILADDFIHVLPSGMITKRQHLAYLRSRTNAAPEPSRHFEQLQIRIYGDTAVATGAVLAQGAAPDSAPHKTYFTDVFVFRNNRWQAVNAQEIPAQ